MPIPPPINSQSVLCLGVALKSRGNQPRGTEMVRPSASTTLRLWVEQDTSTARALAFSTEVLMPPLQEELPVLEDKSSNLREFVVSKAPHVRQSQGFEPKLCVASRMTDVDVRWLAALHAEEEEPVAQAPGGSI